MKTKTILSCLYYNIILLILVMGFVSAEGDFYKVNTNANLKVTCYDGDKNYCDSSTACLITISYPDSTLLLADGTMEYHNSFFNYTVPGSYLSNLGVYQYSVNCQDPDFGAVAIGSFEVTPSGGNSLGNNYIAIIIVLIVFAGGFVFVGNTLDNKLWLLKSGLFFTGLLVMLINLGIGLQVASNSNISSLVNTALIIGVSAFGIFLMYLFINYMVKIIKSFKEARRVNTNDDLL